ncbi:hypothetical protein GCM10027347_59140 [Larkinella harenae]
MTIIQTIWLTSFLNLFGAIALHYLMPWIDKKREENRLYRQQLLEISQRGLQDHEELGKMLLSNKDRN